MSTGGSGGDAGITYVLRAVPDANAKKAFDELIGMHRKVTAEQLRVTETAAAQKEAITRRVVQSESKALAAVMRETERAADMQRARSRAVSESQRADILRVEQERQKAAERGIRAVARVAESIVLSEKKAADAAIAEEKRKAARVDQERQRGIDRLFAGLSRVAAKIAIEEKKNADVAIREAQRADAARAALAAKAYRGKPFAPDAPRTHMDTYSTGEGAAAAIRASFDHDKIREERRQLELQARIHNIRSTEREAARRRNATTTGGDVDPAALAGAISQAERAQERLSAKIQLGATGVVRLVSGFAQLGIAGEESSEKLLRGLVQINAAVDLFSGSINLIRAIVSGYDAWTKATLATAAAHEILAGSKAKAGAMSAGGAASGAGGAVVAGGASAAAGVLGIAAAATAVVGALVLFKEHLDGTSAQMGGLSGKVAPAGQWLGEMRFRANRALGGGDEGYDEYKQSVEAEERTKKRLDSANLQRQRTRESESLMASRERIEGSGLAQSRLTGIMGRLGDRQLGEHALPENASRDQIDAQLRKRFFGIGVAESETRGVLGGLQNRQAGKGAFGREGTGVALEGDALAQNLNDQKDVQESLIELEKQRIAAVREWAVASKQAVDDQISGLKETLKIEQERADAARAQVDSTAASFGRLDPFEQQRSIDAFRKFKKGDELSREDAEAMRGLGFGKEADASDAARARKNKDFGEIDLELRRRAEDAAKKVDKIQLEISQKEEIKLAITVKADEQVDLLVRKLKPIRDEIIKSMEAGVAEAFEKLNREIADRDLSRMPGA